MTEPLSVLMVTARYLPSAGGTELHVDQVAHRLAARGIEMTVLTTDPSGTLPAQERLHGVNVRRVRAWPAERDYYFAPRIYSELVRGRWDVVHVQGFHTFVAPLAMLAATRSRRPFLLTFHAGGHSSRLRHSLRPLQLLLLRPLLGRAARLIALAPFEVDDYSSRLHIARERFVVIPNGSDLPRPAVGPATHRDGDLIASVGRLERYKGHHRVIEALPHILRRRPQVRLWLGGSGPYEASLRRLAEKLQVSDRVEIRAIPVEDRERMARQLAEVKVVVSLSEFETQPVAALEAAALGCRLVVAQTPGLRELAEAGLARTVPSGSSPREVAAVVLEELERPPVAARPELPTWDECAEALLELYEAVARAGDR